MTDRSAALDPAGEAPACIPGPNGPLTFDDLPAPETGRWVARRKAEVAAAVQHGLISAQDACDRWSLSDEELSTWTQRYSDGKVHRLQVTKLKRYRQG